MDGVVDELLISAASHMNGLQRRMFQAAVCLKLCDGNTRQSEYRFGWGRNTIAQGMRPRHRGTKISAQGVGYTQEWQRR